MKIIENKGITLVALIITIVVMMIIAGIAVNEGSESIEIANLESKKTNMLLIKAQAKKYVEEVNYRFGIKPENLSEEQKNSIRIEIYETQGKLQKASEAGITTPSGVDISKCYYVTQESLENMGLNQVSLQNNEKYYVSFDEENVSVEVYNTEGFKGKYSLTDIENKFIGES